MLQTRHRFAPVAAAAALSLAALLGACAPAQDSGTSPESTTSAPAPVTTDPAGGGVTEAQAVDLCTRMEGQLSNWRTYTPSIGRGGFNILVGEWGAANGVDLIALAGDRQRVDAITSAQCPDVREEAMTALEIPDLASGLVGF